jgi:hypothetical protein
MSRTVAASHHTNADANTAIAGAAHGYTQLHSGNSVLDAEFAYHQSELIGARQHAQRARQAKQARKAKRAADAADGASGRTWRTLLADVSPLRRFAHR